METNRMTMVVQVVFKTTLPNNFKVDESVQI